MFYQTNGENYKGPYIKYDRNFLAFFDPLPLWLQNDVIVTK